MKCLSFLIIIEAISAFAPPIPLSPSSSQRSTMASGRHTQPPPHRRTSSIAYDNGSKEKYSRIDLWRKRLNLPPNFVDTTPTALSSSSSSSSHTQQDQDDEIKPIYTFGVLTDIQYAPIPDGHSYSGNPRYYRHAKTAAEYAAKHFEEEQVQCVVNLGDIIDGKCSTLSPPEVEGCVIDANDAIDDVLEALSNYKSGRILHTYGNHELYNLSREDLAHKLSIPFTLEPTNDLVGYYDHLLHESQQSSSMKLRFIVLDSYDICLLGRCAETSPKRHAAHRIMAKNNPNFPEEENSPEGLEGLSKRFVGFNGGVDEPQLDWLEQSLQMARDNDEKVILCSHQPIHPDSSYPTCLVWNYDEILTIVRKYNDVVIASFSGHAHKGGYFRDDVSGVHFRTFEAVLESQHPVRTYATVDVWEDRLVVRGWGDCVSDVYDFDHLNTGVENNLTRN